MSGRCQIKQEVGNVCETTYFYKHSTCSYAMPKVCASQENIKMYKATLEIMIVCLQVLALPKNTSCEKKLLLLFTSGNCHV